MASNEEVRVVLNAYEKRVLDDVQRFWARTAEEPVAPVELWPHRGERALDALIDMPAPVVATVWIAFMLALFGAPVAGLALGAATAAGWALRRSRPHLRRNDGVTRLPEPGEVGAADGKACRQPREPGPR